MSFNEGEVIPVMPGVSSFGHKLTTERTNETLFSFVRLLLDGLSESGWAAAGLDILAGVTCNDVPYLCNLDPDILDLQATDQYILRQCLALFSKRGDIDLGVDRKGSAIRKFGEAERACAMTNAALRAHSQMRFNFHPSVEGVLHTASRKISELLGAAPAISDIRLRFGPGASTATPKKNACPVVKLKAGVQCSTNFPEAALADFIAGDFNPATREHGDTVEVGIHLSKTQFVPKNAKIDRAICVEPTLNSMLQLGLGDLMAARLRRVGIDIRDQSANQRAALYGSISGASATLDLSSASDTVSWKLIEHLLPPDWSTLLLDLSTREGVLEGERITFEKISSMGNGFTFPLETLIFWSLSQAVKEHVCPKHRYRVLVYGDDIVVPVECVPLLSRVLTALGFILNKEKSFWTGYFRESCGHDYVLGQNVRPVYVKEPLNGGDFIRLRNFFYRRGLITLSQFWEARIDPSMRLYGPDGFGDGHLVRDDYHQFLKAKKVSGGGGFTFQTFSLKPKRLARKIAEKIAAREEFWVPKWDPATRAWTSTELRRIRSYKDDVLARTLATYTQYCRETRVTTLTESDALRSRHRHVYADRRLPDPQTRDDEDFFVTPGAGSVKRTNIYIFESLP